MCARARAYAAWCLRIRFSVSRSARTRAPLFGRARQVTTDELVLFRRGRIIERRPGCVFIRTRRDNGLIPAPGVRAATRRGGCDCCTRLVSGARSAQREYAINQGENPALFSRRVARRRRRGLSLTSLTGPPNPLSPVLVPPVLSSSSARLFLRPALSETGDFLLPSWLFSASLCPGPSANAANEHSTSAHRIYSTDLLSSLRVAPRANAELLRGKEGEGDATHRFSGFGPDGSRLRGLSPPPSLCESTPAENPRGSVEIKVLGETEAADSLRSTD